MQNIKIKNSLELCTIEIEGAIGVAEEWQFENAGQRVATYEKFRECVAQIEALEAQKVVVNIRSTGGDVNDAMLIYEALCSLGIPITTCCYGYVASAATVIAQAASEGERRISANALYLVHNSTCAAEGNASDLSSKVELLEKTDERLADLYARRSGREKEEFASLMAEEGGNGRWLSAAEAIEAGLADAIIDNAAEGDTSSIKNFWRKLGSKLGLSSAESEKVEVSAEHNILHSEPLEASEQRALQTLVQKQSEVSATALKEVEDPAIGDVMRGKNQMAYDSDALAFKR